MRGTFIIRLVRWRYSLLALSALLVAACAPASASVLVPGSPPTSTPEVRQQAPEVTPSDPTNLASGQYEFLEFYAPL